MIEFEPKSIAFQNIRLQHCYTSSVCLTNPLSAPVDLHIRTSSPILTVQPTKVHLGPSQSIVLTVKVTLSHQQNLKSSDQYVQIKSIFFDQKIPVQVSLAQTDRDTHRSRSPSPSGRLYESQMGSSPVSSKNNHSGFEEGSGSSRMKSGIATGRNSTLEVSRSRSSSPSKTREGAHMVRELHLQLEAKNDKIKRLEEMVGQLESSNPNFDNILRMKLDEQKKSFEEKSAKVWNFL